MADDAALRNRRMRAHKAGDTGYEEDRLLRRADEMHRDLVMYQAHIGGREAVEAARAESGYGQRTMQRANRYHGNDYGREITRGTDYGIEVY